MATYDEFVKIEIRVGTVVRTEAFYQAHKPAIKMWIDFGELGIMTSSAQITRRYMAEELIGGCGLLNLNNIMLNTYSFNTRAIRCYRKIGFKEIGRRHQAKVIQGKSYDIIYMDILVEELTGGSSLPPLSPPE